MAPCPADDANKLNYIRNAAFNDAKALPLNTSINANIM